MENQTNMNEFRKKADEMRDIIKQVSSNKISSEDANNEIEKIIKNVLGIAKNLFDEKISISNNEEYKKKLENESYQFHKKMIKLQCDCIRFIGMKNIADVFATKDFIQIYKKLNSIKNKDSLRLNSK